MLLVKLNKENEDFLRTLLREARDADNYLFRTKGNLYIRRKPKIDALEDCLFAAEEIQSLYLDTT